MVNNVLKHEVTAWYFIQFPSHYHFYIQIFTSKIFQYRCIEIFLGTILVGGGDLNNINNNIYMDYGALTL